MKEKTINDVKEARDFLTLAIKEFLLCYDGDTFVSIKKAKQILDNFIYEEEQNARKNLRRGTKCQHS